MIRFVFSQNYRSCTIEFSNGTISDEYIYFEDAVEAIEGLYIAQQINVDQALVMLDDLLEKSQLDFRVDLNLSPFNFMRRLEIDRSRIANMECVKKYIYENKYLLPGFYRCPFSLDHWHIFFDGSISPEINTVSIARVLFKKYIANGLIPSSFIDTISMQIKEANLPYNIHEN